MKIIHIITSLQDGGAEHTLYKICKYDKQNEHIVISLTGTGKYLSLLNNLGIKVYCLKLKFYSINKFLFFLELLKSLRADVVQTWLVHADLIGGIAARLAGNKNIIWNIRYSNFSIGKAKLETIFIISILVRLSYFIPKLIIVNSKRAKKFYTMKGYDKKKLRFIPNGYDLSILRPNKLEKIIFKKKIKSKKSIPIIGNVARYDPKKDHSNLLKSLYYLKSKNLKFLCVLVGSKIDNYNEKLITEINKLKLSNHIKLLGQNNNIYQVMNGIDIYVQSSSYGEGFPNVVAESMACGTPCVVTDVGEASSIVGETGWVVQPNDSIKLSESIEKALNEYKKTSWNKRKDKSRLRIKKNFYIRKMVESYNEIWLSTKRKNKKLLFDLIASQPQNPIEKKHGGSEYTKVIYKNLIKLAVNKNVKIDAVYNSNVELDKDIKNQSKKYSVNLISIKNKNEIKNVLNQKSYDKFFSGLGYGLRNINIKKYVQFLPVVHGLRPVEMPRDEFEKFYLVTKKQKLITFIKNLFHKQYFNFRKYDYYKFLKKYKDNLVVVSNHTKKSILHFYPDLKVNNIKVLYSPEKSSNKAKIKKNKSKYILMVSASVWIKNSYRGVLALDKFFQKREFSDYKAIILGGLPDRIFNQIKNKQNFEIYDYVTTDQLESFYANAYLFFYPTLNEGFGYPPLEAMKYGTPVITSSNSAVPEICEDSVLYFNPYSIKEMTNMLIKFQSLNYKMQRRKSIIQHAKVKKKQDEDLKKIVKLILS